MNLAISGTFERNDMTSRPSSARSPVEIVVPDDDDDGALKRRWQLGGLRGTAA